MPYKLKIEQDEFINNSPRDWDNMGHMVCWHSRYNLGDEQRRDDVNEWLRELACSLDPSLEERLLYWEEHLRKGGRYSSAWKIRTRSNR